MGKEKSWGVKELVGRGKVGLLTLQETKVHDIDRKMKLDLWGQKKFDCIHKPTISQVGGIMVAWDTNVLDVIESKIGDYSVSVLCRNKEDDVV